jgi:hypothetical protein
MDKLGVYAPTLVGLAALAYTWFLVRRIKREQARSRQTTAAAE